MNFEDAGIYVCDDLVEHRKNLTVLGDRVICKDGALSLKQGDDKQIVLWDRITIQKQRNRLRHSASLDCLLQSVCEVELY